MHRRMLHEGYLSIGVLAQAAGVTTQTIRVWEMRGLLDSVRTLGGHRLFAPQMRDAAVALATHARRTRLQQLPESAGASSLGLASTGMRIRAARLAHNLTQQSAAKRIGISRSFLAAIERGTAPVSVEMLSRLAHCYGMAMSDFATQRIQQTGRVMRAAERPRTDLGGGVYWEELANPGDAHDLEPALLHIPPGCGSGGVIIRPGENFVFVQQGSLIFSLGNQQDTIALYAGDALIIDSGTATSYRNDGPQTAICLWVELIDKLRANRAVSTPPDR